MIQKVISGGQTGADRAALDVAIRLGIPHGGWIPKGRLTEDGPLPDRYDLKETGTTSYPERTEKNVVDSDGTLIVSLGELTGGSLLTRQLAEKHGRPCLHIDLNQENIFQGAMRIREWVQENHVTVLNVAGPRAGGDASIYHAVADILETFLYLDMMETIPIERLKGAGPAASADPDYPQTLEDAVQRLVNGMTLKDRVTVANMTRQEVEALFPRLDKYIRQNFGLPDGNEALVQACRHETRAKNPNDRDVVEVILKSFWKTLKDTHRLKRVK